MQKRILIIRNAAKKDFGGGERAPVFISQEIQRISNLKPIILSGSLKLREFASGESIENHRSVWLPYQQWSGWRVILFPLYLVWQILLFLYYILAFLYFKPALVHPQSRDDFISATYAARLLSIPVIWSDYADLKHNLKNVTVWHKNPVGKLVYLAARLASKIIVVSKEDRRLILNETGNVGWFADKLKVIYNGAQDIKVSFKKDNSFTIVCSSRLVTDKGIGDLLEAFSKFQKEHPESQLRIIGDGPEKDLFIKQAASIKNVEFLGHQSNPLTYVVSCTVFVIPTHHEGFSLALVEACMLGMPIIATDVGGNPEIISHLKTGLLTPVKDPASLERAIERLYRDESLREQLGISAREVFEKKFDFKKIVLKDFLRLYEEVIGEN